eukprot:SAG22_NODE_11515_length_481_cov_0.675393_1_plen_88_part_00
MAAVLLLVTEPPVEAVAKGRVRSFGSARVQLWGSIPRPSGMAQAGLTRPTVTTDEVGRQACTCTSRDQMDTLAGKLMLTHFLEVRVQ